MTGVKAAQAKAGYDPAMALHRPSRIRVMMLLLGGCIATGIQWDVLQVAAWSRMWWRFTTTESIAGALEATFSPERRCELCEAIETAQATVPMEQIVIEMPSLHPPLLPLARIAGFLPPPVAAERLPSTEVIAPPAFPAAPPKPPPRGRS